MEAGIVATSLDVSNYRSFPSYTLALNAGVTILVGRNAAGKTNLVEALQLLTAGASFRKPSPAELLHEGAAQGRARLTLEGEGRLLDMALVLEDGKRRFERNGKRTNAAGVRGVLPSVLFCPDHLDMVKRSARVRRDALDGFGVQLNSQYGKLLSAYERTVEQRNNLLREMPSLDLLAVWDESLAAAGAALLMHRRALLERIRAHFIEVYHTIAPHEAADVAYISTVDGAGLDEAYRAADGAVGDDAAGVRGICGADGGSGDRALATAATDAGARADVASGGEGYIVEERSDSSAHMGDGGVDGTRDGQRARLAARFIDLLAERREDELRRGVTLVGPHRDEVLFTIDGRSARDYGSQGQQRSIVLAWKIAEVEVTRDILGRYPLLLLDDVMSELDAARRDAIMGFVAEGIQTVITTTNLGYFSSDVLGRAKVVHIGQDRS